MTDNIQSIDRPSVYGAALVFIPFCYTVRMLYMLVTNLSQRKSYFSLKKRHTKCELTYCTLWRASAIQSDGIVVYRWQRSLSSTC